MPARLVFRFIWDEPLELLLEALEAVTGHSDKANTNIIMYHFNLVINKIKKSNIKNHNFCPLLAEICGVPSRRLP